MKTFFASAAVALALTTGGASAAVTFADNVISSNQAPNLNGMSISQSRSNPESTLGAEDKQFFSLGRGGSIVLGFGGPATGDIMIYEVTYGSMPFIMGYPESADVFALYEGAETFVGSVNNSQAQAGETLNYAGIFDALRIVDTTPTDSASLDGFDIDAVSVSQVPLPASALLLIGGLAGLGTIRRRKTI